MREADLMAADQVNPNFHFGGAWFSKDRYAIVWHKGRRWPFHMAEKRLVEDPTSEPDSYDPLDWTALMDDYLYWRGRYRKQGYNIRHSLVHELARAAG